MPFRYHASPADGPLLQGEIVGPLWEHQSTAPPTKREEGEGIPYVSIRHSRMIVMSQDCDLDQDFAVRFLTEEARRSYDPPNDDVDVDAKSVSHVLLCDVYEEAEIRPRGPKGSDNWRRVKQNQDERYHHLDPAQIGQAGPEANPSGAEAGGDQEPGAAAEPAELPDLYIDFKKALSLPTRQLYEGLRLEAIPRIAVMPPIYLHDLIHRFYGYLSRVAIID